MRFFLVFVIGGGVATSSFAKPLLNVYIPNSEPWGYYVEHQTEKGVVVQVLGIWQEISDLISQRAGIDFKIRLDPPARIKKNLETGKADLGYLVRLEDSLSEQLYAGYLFTIGAIVVPRKDVAINSYDDLSSLNIGIVRGVDLDPRFDQDYGIVLKRSFRNHEILVNMLSPRRLQSIAGDNVSLYYLLNKFKKRDEIGKSFLLKQTPVWVRFSEKSTKLEHLKSIRESVEYLQTSGSFEKILDNYVGRLWRVESF